MGDVVGSLVGWPVRSLRRLLIRLVARELVGDQPREVLYVLPITRPGAPATAPAETASLTPGIGVPVAG